MNDDGIGGIFSLKLSENGPAKCQRFSCNRRMVIFGMKPDEDQVHTGLIKSTSVTPENNPCRTMVYIRILECV